MTTDFPGFVRPRTGAGFFRFALFCALISGAAGYATYFIGLRSYTADKREEKVTALELVDAFVTNYSEIRVQLRSATAPVSGTGTTIVSRIIPRAVATPAARPTGLSATTTS